MKKFFTEVFKYVILVATVLLLFLVIDVFVVGNQYNGSFNASIKNKVSRLEEIDTSKIILVGNSNVTFGFDSKLLEEKMGMPVVNMGIHAGLGNRFHENLAKFNISEGDIIIICHSDYGDNGDIDRPELVWLTLEKNFYLYNVIFKDDFFKDNASSLLKSYPKYMLKCFNFFITKSGNATDDTSYCVNAFDGYGDVVYYDESGKVSTEDLYYYDVHIHDISNTCIERLNELNAYVKTKNATMLIAAFPILDGYKTPDDETILKFESELKERVECDVISSYLDYKMPPEYFYDSELHLNASGSTYRTELLIDDLNKWFENK